jgi:hypothetical protein
MGLSQGQLVLCRLRRLSVGCLILTLLGLAGCGAESRLAAVEGKVTVDGKPVNSGRVFFRSPDGKHTIIAKIRPDGTYRALDVPYVAMRVSVTPLTKWERMRLMSDPKNGAVLRASEARETPGEAETPRVIIPEKYQDPNTSGLTFTAASETNTYNIEISSE